MYCTFYQLPEKLTFHQMKKPFIKPKNFHQTFCQRLYQMSFGHTFNHYDLLWERFLQFIASTECPNAVCVMVLVGVCVVPAVFAWSLPSLGDLVFTMNSLLSSLVTACSGIMDWCNYWYPLSE